MSLKINPSNIDWSNEENYFFINSRDFLFSSVRLSQDLPLKGCLLVMTSGSGGRKCACLSKKAFLCSARAVNSHLEVQPKDRWLLALPLFHVGGLSILARCFLSHSSFFVLSGAWNPSLFLSRLKEQKITLTSLVPAQVYDLVSLNLKAPKNLRAVVVGGSALHETLYKKARRLGWPLLPSYGLTECCSQTATAPLSSLDSPEYPKLKVLSHCDIQIRKGFIAIRSESVLTGWIYPKGSSGFYSDQKQSSELVFESLESPLIQGWLLTEDQGLMINQRYLRVFGRTHSVKIKGENVSLYELENILTGILAGIKVKGKYQLFASPHSRNGHQIDLAFSLLDLKTLSLVLNKYNKKVLPFERIVNCYFIPQWPEGSLSKVKIKELKRNLGFLDEKQKIFC